MGFGVLDDLPGRPGSGGVVIRRSPAGRRLRDLERPSNLTGGAAGKVVAKLLTVEEIQSRGSCVASRRGRCAHPAHHHCASPSEAFRRSGVDDEATEAATDELPKKRIGPALASPGFVLD